MSLSIDLSHCTLCPRTCLADRTKACGACGAGALARVALVSLHPWEEPCLVGADGRGAGTVFFSSCNMHCLFCQNHEISQEGKGEVVTDGRLAEIFLEQQARGAATLDLVTPTVWEAQILHALTLAKAKGFSLPVVWNTGSYERAEMLELLRGSVDIFLPDMKYAAEESAGKFSAAPDYFKMASKAIEKMFELVGEVRLNSAGQMKRGVLIRHLVLPEHRKESMKILDWIYERFGDKVQISLMRQYTPMYRAKHVKGLNRRLTTFEYESVVEHARKLGIMRCYVQESPAADTKFVPVFDGTGVL